MRRARRLRSFIAGLLHVRGFLAAAEINANVPRNVSLSAFVNQAVREKIAGLAKQK